MADTTPGTGTLTGVTKAAGVCECCSRRITQRVFSVRYDFYLANPGR